MPGTRLHRSSLPGAHSLVTALFIDALGSGLFIPFSLLYFQVVSRLPLQQIGLALSLATLLTLPMTPITGFLADRFGSQRIIVGAQLLEALAYTGYLFVNSFPTLLLTALLATGGIRVFWVAFPTFIAENAPTGEKDRWYGLTAAAQNGGVALGGVLAGLAISLNGPEGYQLLVIADVISFLIAGLLILRLPHTRKTRNETMILTGGYLTVLKDLPFIGIVLCNIPFTLGILMLEAGLPVYLIYSLHQPPWVAGFALTLSTIMLALAQSTTTKLVDPLRRTRILILAGLMLIIGCTFLMLTTVLPTFLVLAILFCAIVGYTAAELLQGPTISTLVAEAGSAPLQGRYIAAYQLFGWGVSAALAPGLFTSLFSLGPIYPWLTLAGLSLLASMGILLLEPHLPMRAVMKSRKTQ